MTNAEARCNKSLRPRKPEGSLGRTAQDVHLDSHTAPELCVTQIITLTDLYCFMSKCIQGVKPTWLQYLFDDSSLLGVDEPLLPVSSVQGNPHIGVTADHHEYITTLLNYSIHHVCHHLLTRIKDFKTHVFRVRCRY